MNQKTLDLFKCLFFMAKLGRPTKYKPEYCEAIIKYFNIEPHFETPVVITDKKGNTREEIKFIPSDLPLLCGFAVSIGVSSSKLSIWAKKHKEFRKALKIAKDCQKKILVTNGLKGLYSPAFAIFTAKNILGWRDKTEFSGKDGQPLGVVILPPEYDKNKMDSPSGATDRGTPQT